MNKYVIITAVLLKCFVLNGQWQHLTTGLGSSSVDAAKCFAIYNAKLVVGGNFSSAGGNFTDNIAAWDGSNWSTLNTGLQGGDGGFSPIGSVNALTVYNSNLIAAGIFTSAATTTLCNIAQWNGTSWANIANTMGWTTYMPILTSLVVYNNKLIAAGTFTSIAGTAALNIAQWDGSNWSSLGTGIENYTAFSGFGTVRALAVFNNELYAGGTFTNAGGTTVSNIAKWNGTSWSTVGTGISSCNYYGITSLGVYNNELYAGNSTTGISKWNGTVWSTVGGGLGPAGCISTVNSICIYNNKLIVGGDFSLAGIETTYYIAAWDGTTWSYIGGIQGYNGFDYPVNTVSAYSGCLYAGGRIASANDFPQVVNLNHVSSFCGIIGIEEYSMKNRINISPNPSTDRFTFTGLIESNSIEICDVTGRRVYYTTTNEDKLTLDLSTKDKGVYFYKITDRNRKVQQGKLVIQ